MTRDITMTVCTPTYNRCHTLGRVYESLAAQTAMGFEWVVVDDGSTDDTGCLVREWVERSPFPIRYCWQENAGKPAAVRAGAALAVGELFLVADSDDAFVPETIEVLVREWRAIPSDRRAAFCGVACLCQGPDGQVLGDSFPPGVLESDFAELYFYHRVRSEKWWAVRTDLMRRFTSLVPEGLGYVPEGATWFRIAREHRVRLVNRPLRIYHHGGPGVMSAPPGRHAAGAAYYARMLLTEEWRWARTAPAVFAHTAANLTRFALHDGQSLAAQWRALHGAARALWVMALPAGVGAWAVDCMLRRG